MSKTNEVHVIEHRRVLGGDWVKVQTVRADLVGEAGSIVARYNEMSGVGDWRVRALSDSPVRAAPPSAGEVVEPSRWARLRFWWVLRTSKRAR